MDYVRYSFFSSFSLCSSLIWLADFYPSLFSDTFYLIRKCWYVRECVRESFYSIVQSCWLCGKRKFQLWFRLLSHCSLSGQWKTESQAFSTSLYAINFDWCETCDQSRKSKGTNTLLYDIEMLLEMIASKAIPLRYLSLMNLSYCTPFKLLVLLISFLLYRRFSYRPTIQVYSMRME